MFFRLTRCVAFVAVLAMALPVAARHSGVRANPSGDDFQRLQYNNPNATTWLKASLFGTPIIYDFNGDGNPDVCYCVWPRERDWCWCGIHYFENPSPRGARNPRPLFGRAKFLDSIPPRKIEGGRDLGFTGKPLDRKAMAAIHFEPETADVAFSRGDLDGDGLSDMIVTVNDRKAYGWHDRYDERGTWKTGISPCWFYILMGAPGSTKAVRKYLPAELLRTDDGYPVVRNGVTRPLIWDWDGDGDCDIVTIDAVNAMHYYENKGRGADGKPCFDAARILRSEDGRPLEGHLALANPVLYDWDGDGFIDILMGEEDSRLCWFRNAGKSENGVPVFDPPFYFRQKADELYFGAMSTPFAYDLDGDGDEDIICGNTAGEIGFVENLSGKGVEFPKWAEPKLVEEPDGKAIRITAGPNGSIQGPLEAKWGYTAPSVADWDGDGLPDIMSNTIWGKPLWWRNIGTRRKPKFDYARGVEVEWIGEQPELPWGWFKPKTQKNPKEIITQWRTTPVMIDWNGDGLVDLVMTDVDGDLALWRREKREGRLVLLQPEKAFVDAADGKPLRASRQIRKGEWLGGWGGASGRRKIAIMDWDCDGRVDVVMNNADNAAVWRQEKADSGKWYFRKMADSVAKEPLWSHNPQPARCDFNGDGRPDILLGAFDGYIYYLRNPLSRGKHSSAK